MIVLHRGSKMRISFVQVVLLLILLAIVVVAALSVRPTNAYGEAAVADAEARRATERVYDRLGETNVILSDCRTILARIDKQHDAKPTSDIK
jgi:hypothetical protein